VLGQSGIDFGAGNRVGDARRPLASRVFLVVLASLGTGCSLGLVADVVPLWLYEVVTGELRRLGIDPYWSVGGDRLDVCAFFVVETRWTRLRLGVLLTGEVLGRYYERLGLRGCLVNEKVCLSIRYLVCANRCMCF
jgi:hypothetical protein